MAASHIECFLNSICIDYTGKHDCEFCSDFNRLDFWPKHLIEQFHNPSHCKQDSVKAFSSIFNLYQKCWHMQLDIILSHYFIKTVSCEVILFGNIIVGKVFEVLLSTRSKSVQVSSLLSSEKKKIQWRKHLQTVIIFEILLLISD